MNKKQKILVRSVVICVVVGILLYAGSSRNGAPATYSVQPSAPQDTHSSIRDGVLSTMSSTTDATDAGIERDTTAIDQQIDGLNQDITP